MARQKLSVKDIHVGNAFDWAKRRAKDKNLPFTITKKYLRSIATDECPIFHTPFEWGSSGLGSGKFKPNGPQLDRIEPELGYVEGNVAFISHRANRLKDNGTMQEHYDIADWIWSHLYAKPNSTPPVPKRTNLKGIHNSKPGAIPTTGAGQDDNDTHHHCGTISGEDTNHRAQTGSGDSVGRGSKEVGTSFASFSFQNYGVADTEIISIEYEIEHIPNKP